MPFECLRAKGGMLMVAAAAPREMAGWADRPGQRCRGHRMAGFLLSLRLLTAGALVTLVAGCGGSGSDAADPRTKDNGGVRDSRATATGQGLAGQNRDQGTLFGPGGIFGSKDKKDDGNGTGVAVNAFLWRASLDTINFIPLISADPFGGVIITDWYTPAESPSERLKIQITILDRELRADGVRVSVFKQQVNAKGGGWVDAQVDPHTNTDIENAILTRARQLRIAQGGS